MKRMATGLLAAGMLAALVGCAGMPDAGTLPLLRLPPASLGSVLALQQRLTVEGGGQRHQFLVALEADGESVRLAVQDLGQTVARLEWDGSRLEQSSAPGWPPGLAAERILSELQLVYWPLAALQPVLPAGWSVSAEPDGRMLRHHGRPVLTVRRLRADEIEMVNLAAGYRVLIESRPGGQGS